MIDKARTIAETGSDCQSRHVGAVIIQHNQLGFVGGYNHSTGKCKETGCPRKKQGIKPGEGLDKCHAIHAEVDAIERAKRCGVQTEGSHIHVTHQPCDNCAKEIIKAGIRSVTYHEEYPNSNSLEILGKAGIAVMKVGD